MIVSFSHRVVFIHIGKTAGDSVTAAFQDILGAGDVCCENTGLHRLLHKHAPAHEARTALHELGYEWRDFYSFCVMRNPFEILHSDYWYHRRKGQLYPDRAGTAWESKCIRSTTQTFAEYVQAEYGHWDKGFFANYAQSQGETNRRSILSNVLRHESLATDFAVCCRLANLPPLVLPRDNATAAITGQPRPPLHSDYTDDLIRFVEKMFAEDLELFGYTFAEAV